MTEAPLWIKGRLGTSLYYPLIILQSRNFVNSQNAQMMKQKFFLSNNIACDENIGAFSKVTD